MAKDIQKEEEVDVLLENALEKLDDLLEKEKSELDPETLLLIRQAILDQSKELRALIDKLDTSKFSEKLLVEAKVQTRQFTHLAQMLVNLLQPNKDQIKAKQSWWERALDGAVKKPVEAIKDFISDQLELTRKKPKYAIGVRLVNKEGDRFYDAIGGAVGRAVGGVMSRSATNNLALETTLQDILTQLTAINASTDQLEGFTDGLEGFTDGIETLLTDLKGLVDGLEGFVDGIESQLITLIAKDFATETTLASIKDTAGIKKITDALPAGTNLVGDVDVAPRTTGGWSVGNFTSGDTYTALTNTAQVIKGSAGKFGGYYIFNPNTAATYVMVYNIAAASVTVGTSTAILVFCIPASSAANLELLAGIPFSTAMSIAAATTGGGSTAPATALEAMVFYK